MNYDWSGARARRIKLLKASISLLIVLAAISYPAMVLFRAI
ncbi:hypothetical protein AB4Z52_28045 [Rhizobium sp. 2YAF20]